MIAVPATRPVRWPAARVRSAAAGLGAAAALLLTGCAAQNGDDDAATIPAPELSSPATASETRPAPGSDADASPSAAQTAQTPGDRQSAEESPTSSAAETPPAETGSAETESAQEPDSGVATEPSWDPESIHVLVNRQNPLDPMDYAPDDLVIPHVRLAGPEAAMSLREEPARALESMFAAAAEDGMILGLTSAYRSFDYQMQIYSARHAEVGTEATDLYMSRPGYSEHQTGLAADVISVANPECILGECFAGTPEGQWVAQNAHRFGFIIRYPEGMEHITGYPYEPWHLRYVGTETAAAVHESQLTLEEFWDQPAAPEYDQPEPDPRHLTYLQ